MQMAQKYSPVVFSFAVGFVAIIFPEIQAQQQRLNLLKFLDVD